MNKTFLYYKMELIFYSWSLNSYHIFEKARIHMKESFSFLYCLRLDCLTKNSIKKICCRQNIHLKHALLNLLFSDQILVSFLSLLSTPFYSPWMRMVQQKKERFQRQQFTIWLTFSLIWISELRYIHPFDTALWIKMKFFSIFQSHNCSFSTYLIETNRTFFQKAVFIFKYKSVPKIG